MRHTLVKPACIDRARTEDTIPPGSTLPVPVVVFKPGRRDSDFTALCSLAQGSHEQTAHGPRARGPTSGLSQGRTLVDSVPCSDPAAVRWMKPRRCAVHTLRAAAAENLARASEPVPRPPFPASSEPRRLLFPRRARPSTLVSAAVSPPRRRPTLHASLPPSSSLLFLPAQPACSAHPVEVRLRGGRVHASTPNATSGF
ncbi:hypothetical protein H8959_009576 [Pygathrix nigripes]